MAVLLSKAFAVGLPVQLVLGVERPMDAC